MISSASSLSLLSLSLSACLAHPLALSLYLLSLNAVESCVLGRGDDVRVFLWCESERARERERERESERARARERESERARARKQKSKKLNENMKVRASKRFGKRQEEEMRIARIARHRLLHLCAHQTPGPLLLALALQPQPAAGQTRSHYSVVGVTGSMAVCRLAVSLQGSLGSAVALQQERSKREGWWW
jgi:hypothetical protein